MIVSDVPLDTVTIIAAHARFIGGTLEVQDDLRIDGYVEADVISPGRIIVSPQATVRGGIQAANLTIAGSVDGDLVVTDCLLLRASATLNGSVQTGRLVVEDGVSGQAHFTIGAAQGMPAPALRISGDGAAPSRVPRAEFRLDEAAVLPLEAADSTEAIPAASGNGTGKIDRFW